MGNGTGGFCAVTAGKCYYIAINPLVVKVHGFKLHAFRQHGLQLCHQLGDFIVFNNFAGYALQVLHKFYFPFVVAGKLVKHNSKKPCCGGWCILLAAHSTN